MNISGSFSVTGEISEASLDYFRKLAEDQWPAQLKRIQNLSKASGMEVTYDLSMFDLDWSPIYRHDNDKPVAWVNRKTGERHNGPLFPA